MFFQISPVIHKKPKAIPQVKTEDEQSKAEILSLGPFTPNPKIVFDNVVIGTVQSRNLLVQNPTGHDINLFVKKPIPEEMNLILSWTEAKIEKQSEVLLEMVWGPVSEEACRHSFILSDGKRINRDIAITFKSVKPKQVKANGTQKRTKPKMTPPKLQLKRKPVSPTKKLRPQKGSPSPKKKSAWNYNSSPQKYRRVEHKMYKEVSEKQQFYSYQTSAWERENNCFHDKPSFKENKENVSPDGQHYLCNFSESFPSPTNFTFSVENKKYSELTNPFRQDPIPERRKYSILYQIEHLEKHIQSNSTFEIEDTYIQVPETLSQRSKEISPKFRDSLEPPSVSALREKYDDNQCTPTLESMLNKGRSNRNLLSPNFEDKLKVPSFSFSPANGSPNPNAFFPSICSTTSKPSSTNNSRENIGRCGMELYVQTNNQTIENNETYTKINTSSATYVKDNSSFETYVKGNLSGDTYIKDSSLSDLVNLDVSPLSTRTHLVPSPVFLRPKYFESAPVAEFNARTAVDLRLGVNLSAIAEESCIGNDSYLRVGSKRKSSSFSGQPTKRERTSVEPKKDWTKTGGAAVRIAKNSSGLNLRQFRKSLSPNKAQIMSSVSETSLKTVIVQNPFLYANIIDPFMTSQIYSNDEWLDQQEQNFRKWLNALLTPPEELSTKNEVDVAKVWHECTKKEVSEASTKEMVSLNYHTNKKLDFLRKQAQHLFRSEEMSNILQKVCLVVESGKLSIREDKDLHLNLKLKSDITRLILGYNPLWLRIGLETIYNEVIPLKSNSDAHGLAKFILERFLKDPYLFKKYKTVYAPKYSSDLKKYILKKFLILVYFLDRAKNEKLIQHDPCLFCKNAEEKESKSVLIHFARETLAAVGDITKYLKCLGYVVTHAQTYIHEFEYAVKNLGVDLRDGVRLAKIMEIIQMRSDLTKKLRVPAISRLQKVHNMQLVFKSLEESGYQIQYDISPKDIVDGYREKTLSFLWQIIYKFEAPLMVKSATTVQTWFRSLPVLLKRRQLKRNREKREMAAQKIQSWYRHQKMSQRYFALAEFVIKYVEERKRLLATIKIQSFIRMIICRRRYLCQYRTILKLQASAKGWLIRHNYRRRIDAAVCIQRNFRRFTCQKQFLRTRNAAITIQRRYRANKQMKQISVQYKCLKESTINIQRRYRAVCEMRICRRKYITFKTAVVKIQSFVRMHIARKRFLLLQSATKVIQTRYRAQIEMRTRRAEYVCFKKAAICIQQRFRANMQMKYYRSAFKSLREAVVRIQSFYRMHRARKQFMCLRSATTVIQARYRALTAMRILRNQYVSLKKAVVCIQTRFRANLEMKTTRDKFLQLRKASITIQSCYRMFRLRKRYLALQGAAKVIQQRYRAQKAMKEQTSYFKALRKSVVNIQRRFIANKLQKDARHKYLHVRQATIAIQAYFRMYTARTYFLKLKGATLFVQRKYLAQKAMKKERGQYQTLKSATLVLQRRWRARQMCIQETSRYNEIRQSTINIQRRFRANKLMLRDRRAYLEIKSATVKIQQWYRSVLITRSCRRRYILLKKSVIIVEQRYIALQLMRIAQADYQSTQKATEVIQQYYRALLQMRNCKRSFSELKSATIAMQRRYRANKLMQKYQTSYQTLRKTAVYVQNVVRANKKAKYQRNFFLAQRNAAVKIQRWYRATVEMRKCRNYYASLKLAVATTQAHYKAKKLMLNERNCYQSLRKAAVIVQVRYRALLETRRVQQRYVELKDAAIVIQRRYRANLLARVECERYQELRRATIVLQRKYRAKRSMQNCKEDYITLRRAVIVVQNKYRAKKTMLECRREYQSLQSACLRIQRWYRAQKLMFRYSLEYRLLKQSVVRIQQTFRANLLARKTRSQYIQLRNSVVIIQRRYRAQVLMRKERQRFIQLRAAVIFTQTRFKANILMKQRRAEFLALKKAATTIQNQYRALIAMKTQRSYFEKLKKAAVFVQQKYRANKIAKATRSDYVRLKNAAVVLQRRFRGRILTTMCVTKYTAIKWAAVVIQRRFRAEMAMRKEMSKYTKLRHATFVIQRKLRATLLTRRQRYWFLCFKRSVKIIQTFYRSYLVAKRQRDFFLTTRTVVINIQGFARGYLLRKEYAPLLTPEAIEARRVLKKRNAAAVKIQACWRGYSLRKSNIPVITALRKRIEHKAVEPKPSCQGKTLAQRCDAAMLCMATEYSSLIMIISSLKDLDFITRHSRDLCIRLSEILPHELYFIITSAARSLPEMNALNMATLILINFCKFPQTRENSWNPEYMDGVINVLLHWCDKEAPLFSSLCTLLWLFGHSEEWKKFILALPNIHHRLMKIDTLVHRKQNMVMKSKKVNNNSVYGPVRNQKLPMRTASWGLDYDRPNTFTNAVFALTNLLSILDIKT